MNKTQGKEY